MSALTRLVAIVMPAYNEARWIAAKIQNLAGQEYPAGQLQVLIGCDGCTDNTAEAARRAGYPADGPHMPRGWRAPAAALAGIAGLLALYVGFRKMAGALDPDGHVAMYFASALIALYMTWGALWLFRRMGLAGAHAALHGDSTK